MKTMINGLRAIASGALLTIGLMACDAGNGYAEENNVDTNYVGYQTSVPVTPDSTTTSADNTALPDTSFEDTHPNDGRPIDYDDKKPY